MGKNNVVFTKDGLRVNVKNVQNESYLDQTQSFFVKAWELGSASGANEADDATKRQRCVSLCMRTVVQQWLTVGVGRQKQSPGSTVAASRLLEGWDVGTCRFFCRCCFTAASRARGHFPFEEYAWVQTIVDISSHVRQRSHVAAAAQTESKSGYPTTPVKRYKSQRNKTPSSTTPASRNNPLLHHRPRCFPRRPCGPALALLLRLLLL